MLTIILTILCVCLLILYLRARRKGVDARTLRKEFEDSASLQKQIFDNVSMPVVLFDLDYNIVAANPGACESTGSSEETLIGKKCYRTLCGFDAPPDWCPMRKTVDRRETVRFEYAGHGHEYIVSTQPVFDSEGKLVYVLETALDISEQKEQSRQLGTNHLLLTRAADLAKISYFTASVETGICIIAGNTELGLQESTRLRDWMIPEDRARLDAIREELATGKRDSGEMICHTDMLGQRRSYQLALMRNQDRPGFYIGVLQDVTDHIALEGERQQLIKSLNNYVENERIVNACLSQIVREENFDCDVQEILRIIATQLGSDRAYFGVFNEESGGYTFEQEWLRENVSSLKTIRDCRFHAQFLKWKERFLADELLTISDIPHSEYAEVLREPGCQTLICSPVWVEKHFYGILGVGFIRERRDISELDKNIMRSAARIIALSREHHLQREALDALGHQNRLIFNAMPIPVRLFDCEGRLLRSNPAAAMFAALPGMGPVGKALATGIPCSEELHIESRECLATATPIRDRDGKLVHVLESLVDLTEINEGKRQLEVAMRAAQAADKAKTYFLATMSHELRTPLNAVIGFSELLKSSGVDPKEQSEALDAIHEAGTSLLELVNDVLDLSKLEAEKMEIIPEFLNPAEFFESVGKIFFPLAKSKGLYFNLAIQPDMPRELKFDRKRLRQVVVNLLGNAFKFTRAGGVTFSASFRPVSAACGELQLTISDTGPGMRPEEIKELFIPFKQHHIRDAEGTGLGLVISRRLAEHMGGAISVESTPGRGSSFFVHLDAVEYRNRVPEKFRDTLPESRAVACSGHALLVDDVPMNLKILEAMLKRLGIDSVCVNSGAEALAAAERELPAVVLTDLWMPEMDGGELALQLSKNPATKNIPVIAVTADVQIPSESRRLFTDLLFKPITLPGLREILGRVLDAEFHS